MRGFVVLASCFRLLSIAALDAASGVAVLAPQPIQRPASLPPTPATKSHSGKQRNMQSRGSGGTPKSSGLWNRLRGGTGGGVGPVGGKVGSRAFFVPA
jgi:hypothetical protein